MLAPGSRRAAQSPWLALVMAALFIAAAAAATNAQRQDDDSPERRAVAFLATEVPRWPAENNCFSCHNNGDAARALYTAARLMVPFDAVALDDTTDWLRSPERWDDNALGLEFSDHALARVQFAGALLTAIDAGVVDESGPLDDAAALVASDQKEDGSWRLDSSGSIGSPATYGTTLATWSALATLKRGGDDFTSAVARGERWLRELEVRTLLDAAGVVLGLGAATDRAAVRQRQACLDLIVQGAAPSGGWGAYLTTPTEPFDTAVVMLALVGLLDAPAIALPAVDRDRLAELIAAGRAFLVAEQLDDGSWVETTRPAGQQSYAQYISTTGWATLALLATQDRAVSP